MSKNHQSGFVSIMVTMIIMSIMTLVVLASAALMRREQRQALDRQLSTQAFYAAESGVNDAIDGINKDTIGNISNCGNPEPLANYNNQLDGDNIKYTCVLIDDSPDSLEYQSIGTKESTIVPMRANEPIQSLKISWEAKDNKGNFTDSANGFAFPKDGTLPTGVLRATLIPGNSLNRAALINDSRTLFFYPQSGSGIDSTNYSSANGAIISGRCREDNTDGPRQCNAIINLPPLNPTILYLRLKAIYGDVSVTITAYSQPNGGGKQLEIFGSQRVIDSTGKAADVLRRIQVRKPIERNYVYPEFAIESMDDICKRLLVQPGRVVVDSSATNPACQL